MGSGGSSSMSGRRGSSSSVANSNRVGDEIGTDAIKEWFRAKLNIPNHAIFPSKAQIVEESEKAWKLDMDTETLDGERDLHYTRWVPKSAVMTPKEIEKADKEQQLRFETGKAKYEKMVAFAKERGVKGVREGLRKETILKKLRQAGYDYKY